MNKRDLELLEYTYQNASMGRTTLKKLLDTMPRGSLKSVVEHQHDDYNRVCMSAETLLHSEGKDPKKPVMSEMMANMGVAMKTSNDKSDANIAEMISKGNARGKIEIEEKLRIYGDADRRAINLAECLLGHLENNNKQLEGYLGKENQTC